MFASPRSEDTKLSQGLSELAGHCTWCWNYSIEWLKGFTMISQLGVGGREGAKRKLVKEYVWRSCHQPIRIIHCNLSFTFLIGKNGTSNNDNHTIDTAQVSGTVLSIWYEIFSSQWLYLAGTIIHILQVRKLKCTAIKKLAQVHTGSSCLSWVSNPSRFMP